MTDDGNPVVCTLTTKQLVTRRLEWQSIGDDALDRQQIDGGVALWFPAELADDVADLADREQGCCGSWLDTAVSVEGDRIRLEVTTENPDGYPVIIAMAGLAGEDPALRP